MGRIIGWGALGILVAGIAFFAGTPRGRELALSILVPAQQDGKAREQERGAAASRLSLKGISGDFAGSELELGPEAIVLGRDPRVCQLVLTSADELVSKRHCTVRLDAASGEVILEDAGSTNGTFVEPGTRLASGGAKRLRPGDRFYLGDRSVMFEVKRV